MKSNVFFVENYNGRQFAVKLLQKGDAYGLDKCLKWDVDKIGVEFYDVTYAGDEFDELGQFVARYYAETLLKHCGGDLVLDDSVYQWKVDGYNVSKILEWISTKLQM